ncbi:MAG: corrinoid protein [Lachnospiraceae bacterium]|nr:corrinoid protein [Lachnospiraceae bacterium]
MALIAEISELLQKGKAKNVKALVQQALDENMDPKEILNDGLLAGMMTIGAKFKNNEVFVPEVLVAARAMNAGLTVLEPKLVEIGNEPVGKAVIGTVQGDLHDIGKNLVVMMLKGAGFEIHDLGVDVAPDAFIDKAEDVDADVICMSALLTTTMPRMQDCVDRLKERGLRDKYIVMIGGAPVNDSFAEQIGADYYTPDAASAAETAKEAVLKVKGKNA